MFCPANKRVRTRRNRIGGKFSIGRRAGVRLESTGETPESDSRGALVAARGSLEQPTVTNAAVNATTAITLLTQSVIGPLSQKFRIEHGVQAEVTHV